MEIKLLTTSQRIIEVTLIIGIDSISVGFPASECLGGHHFPKISRQHWQLALSAATITNHLQIAASIDMVDRMQNVKLFQHGGRHQFMERGIAGLETFLQVAKEDGSVTALEYDLCTALKRNIEQAIQPQQPAMVLFLEMEPALRLLRVRSRSRKGEEAIALDYLERIHRWYHTILFAEPKRFVVARVKVLQEWSHEQVVAAALAAVAQTQETAPAVANETVVHAQHAQ